MDKAADFTIEFTVEVFNSTPQSSPSDSSVRSPNSVDDLDEPTPPNGDSTMEFRLQFENYVEANFGRGTRSQTVTRETLENYKAILAGDSDSSRRRMRLHDQGYRLGTLSSPQVEASTPAAHEELVLWRYKAEGRGNNSMSTKTRPRIVAPVEDFYCLITAMHFASPSASGQKKAVKMISNKYVGIPREVVIHYMRNCPHCVSVSWRRAGVGAEEGKRRADDNSDGVETKRQRLEEDSSEEEGKTETRAHQPHM